MAKSIRETDETIVSKKQEKLAKLYDNYKQGNGNDKARNLLYAECHYQLWQAKTLEELNFIYDHCPNEIALKIVVAKRIADMEKKINDSNHKKIEKANSVKSLLKLYGYNENNIKLRNLIIQELETVCNEANLAKLDFECLRQLVWGLPSSVSFHESAKVFLAKDCQADKDSDDIDRLCLIFKAYPFNTDDFKNEIFRRVYRYFLDKISKESSALKISEHLRSFHSRFMDSGKRTYENLTDMKSICFNDLFSAGLDKLTSIDEVKLYKRINDGLIGDSANLSIELRIVDINHEESEWLKTCTIDDIFKKYGGKVRFKNVSLLVWNRFAELCFEKIDKIYCREELRQFMHEYDITKNSRIGKVADRRMAKLMRG